MSENEIVYDGAIQRLELASTKHIILQPVARSVSRGCM